MTMITNAIGVFDGISCMQLAMQRAKVLYQKYYASEINPHAIAVTQHHFPATIQLGNVNDIDISKLENVDLIGAGSPCQDISGLNKKRLGLKGKKSSLFYKFLEIKEAFPDAYYIAENVDGPGATQITRELKVKPIRLNSSLIVPQSRPRNYWTNIPVTSIPERSYLRLSDILEEDFADSYYQSAAWNKWWEKNKAKQLAKSFSALDPQRAICLASRMYASWGGNFVTGPKGIRRLTVTECERLQTLPDGYCSMIPESKAYEAIGNCWTVDVITHILKHIKN